MKLRAKAAVLVALALGASAAEVRAQQLPGDGSGATEFASFAEAAEFAENAWIFGDYAMVVETLAPLLLPSAPDGVDTDLLTRSFGRLGASAFFGGNTELAAQSFLQLLLLAPRTELDRLVYPAQVIRFFEQVRTDHADVLAPLLGDTSDGDEAVYIERTVREQSILVSMLPFGWGLFAADRDAAGAGYLSAELATGLTSAVMFITNEAVRESDGTFADPGAARTRQAVQLTSGWLFVGLVAANALHGALVHERMRTIEYIRLDGPPDDLQSGAGGRRWVFRFTPILPGSASFE